MRRQIRASARVTGDEGGRRDPESAQRFRRTLIAVMAVQVVTLTLLWMLQQRFAT